MKVKELIRALKTWPQEEEVNLLINYHDGIEPQCLGPFPAISLYRSENGPTLQAFDPSEETS